MNILYYQLNIESRMLKELMKQKSEKKGSKKDEKKTKKIKIEDNNQQDDKLDQIVPIEATKAQSKNKASKKPEKFQLEEKDLDKTLIVPEIKNKQEKLQSWVPKTQQDALNYKTKFDIAQHLGDFQSLTDKQINNQIKEALIKQPPKQIIQIASIKTAVIQKTPQQLKMEQLQKEDLKISKKADTSVKFGPTIPTTNLIYTNQSLKTNQSNELKFKPLQKSAQQIKQQEMEKRRAQEKNLKNESKWTGSNKKEPQKEIVFRDTPLTFINSKNPNQSVGNFAPLTNPKNFNQNTGNFTKNQITPQRRMMDESDGLVILSKEERERRKKLRQQREAQQQAKVLKNAK